MADPPDDRESPGRFHRAAVPQSLELAAAWAWRLVVVAAAVVVLGWTLARLRVVLIPVFVAIILTALLDPLVGWLAKRLGRTISSWIALLSALGVIGGIGYLVQSTMRSALDDVGAQWREALDEIERWLVTGPVGLSPERADRLFDEFGRTIDRARSGLFDNPSSTARLAAELIAGFLLVLVLTFFFLKDGRSMWHWFVERVRPMRRPMLDDGGCAAFRAIQGWIRGVAITGLVDGVLIGLALYVLGVPAALPIAAITFFASFLPIVGATAAGALATAVALVNNGTQTAIAVAIVVLIIQQVEGDILMPMVMYRQVRLHPVVVLIALAIGGAIGGLVGALVAVPLTAAITAFFAAARTSRDGTILLPDDPPATVGSS